MVPGVRRIYFDPGACADLKRRLAVAHAEIDELKNDQEHLIQMCKDSEDLMRLHCDMKTQLQRELQLLKAESACRIAASTLLRSDKKANSFAETGERGVFLRLWKTMYAHRFFLCDFEFIPGTIGYQRSLAGSLPNETKPRK